MEKSEFLRITGITENQYNGKEEIKGSLYLEGTGITSLPDKFTVGGSLDLRGTGITSLPDNLTVGGSLDLRGTGITNNSKRIPDNFVFSWRNGKYEKHDGILSEIISKKGNVKKIKIVGQKNESYLVTDGNGKFAHGHTIKEAKEDLIYKISNIDKSAFEGLNLDDIMTFEKAIEMYRSITGACSQGVKNFVKSNGIENRSYKVSEIIELTNGHYGNSELKMFINQKNR